MTSWSEGMIFSLLLLFQSIHYGGNAKHLPRSATLSCCGKRTTEFETLKDRCVGGTHAAFNGLEHKFLLNVIDDSSVYRRSVDVCTC